MAKAEDMYAHFEAAWANKKGLELRDTEPGAQYQKTLAGAAAREINSEINRLTADPAAEQLKDQDLSKVKRNARANQIAIEHGWVGAEAAKKIMEIQELIFIKIRLLERIRYRMESMVRRKRCYEW